MGRYILPLRLNFSCVPCTTSAYIEIYSFMIFRVRILIEDKTISKSIVLELEFETLHARSTHLVTYCAASEVAEATCIESQFFLAHPVPQIILSSYVLIEDKNISRKV